MNVNYEIITNSGIQLSGLHNVNENLSTHYLIYKIVNNVNGKYYIGQHKTNNIYDRYMGSSKILSKAIDKYQLSSFTKIILFDYDNFNEMNNKEAELVPIVSCYPYNNMSYNLKEGGINGQTTDLSKKKLSDTWQIRLSSMTDDDRKNMTKGTRIWWNSLDNESKQKWKNNVSAGGRKRFEDEAQRKHLSRVLSAIWDDPIIRAEASLKFSGTNNPMYGHSIKEFMTDSDYELRKKHISESSKQKWKDSNYRQKQLKRMLGENNPMYGEDIKKSYVCGSVLAMFR